MDAQEAISIVEGMIGGSVDFSCSRGVLPQHEGETDKFVKDRIYYHVSHRVLPALRRWAEKLRQQEKRREKANGESTKRAAPVHSR